MTRKEIILNTTWDEFEMGTCQMFVEYFNQYIPFVFFQSHKPTPRVSDKMIVSINEVLSLGEKELAPLKTLLYEKYISEQVEEYEGLTQEEVYSQSKVKEIHIDQENDRLTCIYSEMIINTVSNDLVSIIIKDGKIQCLDDGTYFDSLLED